LRDKTGVVQIVFDDSVPEELFQKAEGLRSEYVVGVRGTVRERSAKNADIPTGDIEILADEMVVYSEAETPPIYIKDDDNADENLRLKYRYIDLRKNRMQQNLAYRAKVCAVMRGFFGGEGFVEVETPVLTKPTPEGARDYLVPSRISKGDYYALPQSPQLYKQLLMVGGTDRYFQIARCFRDEDLRADRQPEFTQLDIEMSFVDVDEVIAVQEKFLAKLFSEMKGVGIGLPLPRITYAEAMGRYGSDKPDTRFGMELVDISEAVRGSGFAAFSGAAGNGGSVRGICVPGGSEKISRKGLDKLAEGARTFGAGGLAWLRAGEDGGKSSFDKFVDAREREEISALFEVGPGDLILIAAGTDKVVFASLGWLRCELADRLGLIGRNEDALLWVTEFPLLEADGEGGVNAMHHPFTSPDPRDVHRLEDDPLSVRALAYDIVYNGNEIGGGSIRIHDAALQAQMFELLGLGTEEARAKFGFLLDAFKYGVPPHGGIAYGLDRLVMLMLGERSIRETMAFPKNQAAEDPVSGAPAPPGKGQLEELGLK
jgi:aspartyl-tRNA synthetase